MLIIVVRGYIRANLALLALFSIEESSFVLYLLASRLLPTSANLQHRWRQQRVGMGVRWAPRPYKNVCFRMLFPVVRRTFMFVHSIHRVVIRAELTPGLFLFFFHTKRDASLFYFIILTPDYISTLYSLIMFCRCRVVFP